jgi:hypothetical protein
MLIADIAVDTLMRDGKWSRTSLTMFTAWLFVILIAVIDYIRTGFHFEVWCTMVAVAVGVKITDAWSKKIQK